MTRWERHIRSAIEMGLTWGAAWFGAGILLARVPGFDSDLPFALLFLPFGIVTGIVFSGILGMFARRRGLDRATLLRFAGAGAVIGLLLSWIFVLLRGQSPWGSFLVMGPLLAMASAVGAAVSLAIARRAERRGGTNRFGAVTHMSA
jgi:hypothetical protein